MSEIIFEVAEDEVDGGYSASAIGCGIHTRGRNRALRRKPGRLLGQRLGRIDHRSVQDRSDPPLQTMAAPGGCRDRHFPVGVVVPPNASWNRSGTFPPAEHGEASYGRREAQPELATSSPPRFASSNSIRKLNVGSSRDC